MRKFGASQTTAIVVAAVVGCGGAPEPPPMAQAAEQSGSLAQMPCDGESVDPWVGELRDRVVNNDLLAKYATERFGPPSGCEGTRAADFDGAAFGYVRLNFNDQATLQVETMPPETSIITLQMASGFDDEESALQTLKDYAARRGVRIDWTTPTVSMEDGERTQTFWDPEEGLNASASVVFRGNEVVALRFSLAL